MAYWALFQNTLHSSFHQCALSIQHLSSTLFVLTYWFKACHNSQDERKSWKRFLSLQIKILRFKNENLRVLDLLLQPLTWLKMRIQLNTTFLYFNDFSSVRVYFWFLCSILLKWPSKHFLQFFIVIFNLFAPNSCLPIV